MAGNLSANDVLLLVNRVLSTLRWPDKQPALRENSGRFVDSPRVFWIRSEKRRSVRLSCPDPVMRSRAELRCLWGSSPLFDPAPHPPTVRPVPVHSPAAGSLSNKNASPPCRKLTVNQARRLPLFYAKDARLIFWRKSSPCISTTRHISCSRERIRSPIRSPSVSSRIEARSCPFEPGSTPSGAMFA